jgi:probable phosphoglycerate mutase
LFKQQHKYSGMPMTQFTIIRHGETQWNQDGRHQGQLDSELTPRGIEQANAIARRLKQEHFVALYSSDLVRAVQTAHIIADQCGQTIITDPRLRERNMGIFQGLTWEEIAAKYPQELHQYRACGADYVIPNGESARQRLQRTVGYLEELAQRHPGQSIVVVTHGGVLTGLFRWTLGIPLDDRRRFKLWNASLNVFFYEDGAWVLGTWGDIGHLADVGTLDGV